MTSIPPAEPSPISIVEDEIKTWRELLDRRDVDIATLRAALYGADATIRQYMDRERSLRRQLATVGFAAVGNAAALKVQPGEDGHSHAFVDVVRLRNDWVRLRDEVRTRHTLKEGAGI